MILKGITLGNKPRTSKGYSGSRDPFYQTKQWRVFRDHYLQLNPLCTICSEEDRDTEATVVDHRIPIKQGGAMWDYNNLQGLCKHHNAIKTALDNPNNQ